MKSWGKVLIWVAISRNLGLLWWKGLYPALSAYVQQTREELKQVHLADVG
jgi:hypothetical protein